MNSGRANDGPMMTLRKTAIKEGKNVAFGVWLIGVGFNYLPLAVYAARFHAPGEERHS